MAKNTKKDDDLLILPQEDTDTLVMDKEEVNDDIQAPSDNLITFDEDISDSLDITEDKKEDNDDITDSLDITEENEKKDEDTENGDLFDLTSDEEVKDEIETKEEETDLGLGDLGLDSNDISASNSSVGTMEEILAKAMADLDSRSNTILDEKKSEEDKKTGYKTEIKEIQDQIKKIQDKIDSSDEKISILNSEKEMIEKNIKSLERMKKMDPAKDIKSTTSRKVHNVKRKAA